MKKIFKAKIIKTFKIILPIILSFFALIPFLFSATIKTNKINNNLQNESAASLNISQQTYSNISDLISEANIVEGGFLFNLIKQFNPSITLAQAISENKGILKPKIADQLKAFDNAHATKGWTLDLHGYNWNAIKLSKLKAFTFLKNVNILIIHVTQKASISSSFDISSIDEMSWLSSMPDLEKIQIKFDTPPNYFDTNNVDVSSFSYLSNLRKLQNLDISTFINKTGQNRIIGSILSQSWYSKMPFNFKIWFPEKIGIPSPTENDYEVNVITKSDGSKLKELTKKTETPIEDPTNKEHSPIWVDNIKVEAIMYQNNWYWALDNPADLNKIVCYSPKNRHYYTTIQIGAEYHILSKRIDVYPSNINKSFLERNLVALPSDLIALNLANVKNLLTKTVLIDDVEYKYSVEDGKAILDFDLRVIKYATADESKYFTSINGVLNDGSIKVNSVERISSSYTQSKPHRVDVRAPNSISDVLKLDSINIHPILSNGRLWWDDSIIDRKKIKYYSLSTNSIFTNVDELIKPPINSVANDLNLIGDLPSAPALTEFIEDNGELTILKYPKVKETINVDGKTVPQVIRNGNLYWDIDIEKIRYVVTEADGSKKYFTTYTNLENDNPANVAKATTLLQINSRNIPSLQNIIVPSYASKNQIFIDGRKANKILREGKYYWDIKVINKNLEDIKYVDSYGNYYTKLPDSFKRGLTEVNKPDPQPTYSPKYTTKFSSNTDLEMSNYNIFGDGFFVDGIKYEFKFLNSKVYVDHFMPEIKYVENFNNPNSIEFFSSLTSDLLGMILRISESNSFSYEKINEDLLPVLDNPISEIDSVKFMNNVGVIMTITAKANQDGGFAWNNDIIRDSKYLITTATEQYYANELNAKTLSGFTDVSNISMRELVSSVQVESGQLKKTNNDIILYSVIGAVAFVNITFAGLIIYKTFKKGGA